jgi:hypothetical protein
MDEPKLYKVEPKPIFLLSVREVMTCLRVKRLLLISIVSLLLPLPVKAALSLPAKSTICNLLTTILSGDDVSTCSIVRVSMLCEREEQLFILCEATILFFRPK